MTDSEADRKEVLEYLSNAKYSLLAKYANGKAIVLWLTIKLNEDQEGNTTTISPEFYVELIHKEGLWRGPFKNLNEVFDVIDNILKCSTSEERRQDERVP